MRLYLISTLRCGLKCKGQRIVHKDGEEMGEPMSQNKGNCKNERIIGGFQMDQPASGEDATGKTKEKKRMDKIKNSRETDNEVKEETSQTTAG